jgi:T5SS/PEP-CTERM-associated repeat protein
MRGSRGLASSKRQSSPHLERRQQRNALLAAAVLAATTPMTAFAADSHWNRSTDGNWYMSTNWTGSSVPMAGDAAYFARSSPVPYTVTSDYSVDIAALAILDDRVRFDFGPTKQFKTGFALLGTAAGQVAHLEFASSKFESYDVRVGHAAGSTGELVVDGSYTVLQTYALYVGDAGHGALTMGDRSIGHVTVGHLAAKPGSSAALSLGGEEASLSFTSLHVGGTDAGAGGTADVTIGPGGRLHAYDTLKVYDGSRIVLDGGILRVATDTDFGPSGLLWNEGRILTEPYTVGGQGLPSNLVLTDGQSLVVYDGLAKTTTIPAGTSLSLAGGSLTTDDIVMSGGTFAFDGGSLTITREVTFGEDPLFGTAYSLAGGKGLTTYGARFNEGYHLDVADGSFTSRGEVFIHGNVDVAGGSFKLEGHLQEVQIGAPGASGARLNFSGASVFGTERDVYVGRGGNGSVAQQDSSAAKMSKLYLGYEDSSTGTYTLGGTSTLETGDLYVGHSGRGTLMQAGGTNSVLGDVALRIAERPGSIGTYGLSAGSLVVPERAVVGNLGTGNFIQAGGTFQVGILDLGQESAGHGTYQMSAGTLAFKNASIGTRGTGAFHQSGGDLISADENGYLRLAHAAGATGSYGMTDGTVTVRRIEVGTGGAGAFTQEGGTVTAWGLSLSASGTGSGSYALDGGELHLDNVWVHQNGSFKQTGGLLTLNRVNQFAGSIEILSPIEFGDDDGAEAEGFNLNGGSFRAGAITVLSNGYLSVGTSTTFSVGTLTQSGGSINGTVTNDGTFNYNGGAFLGRLINRGVVNLAADFSTNGIESHTAFAIPAGRTVTARQSGFLSDGPLDLQGGLVADQFVLGLTRDGTLDHDGAAVTAGFVRIADGPGSRYVYNMTGGTLSADALHVGHKGIGEFHVGGGATPEVQSLTVGSESGSDGRVTLSGPDAALSVGITGSGGVTLGANANAKGRIDVTGGASMIVGGNGSTTIGSAEDSDGAVTVSGAGSSWQQTTSLTLGYRGTGSFSLADGARANVTGLTLGATSGSHGQLSIEGVSGTSRSTLQVNDASFGFSTATVGAGGDAALAVTDGARLDVQKSMLIARLAGSEGHVIISGRAGGFDAEVNVGGDLRVAQGEWPDQGAAGTGSVYVGLGGQLVVAGTTYLGLEKGGAPAGTGRFELDGGYVETARLYATDDSQVILRAGTLVLTQGSLDVPEGPLTLSAERAGESVRLRLRGSGAVYETGNLNVGGSDTAAGNAGRLDIEDSASVRFSGETNLWPPGQINLAGGSLRTRRINRNGGTFNWTRGSLALTHSDLSIGSPDDLAGNAVTLVPVNGRNGLTVGGTTTIGPAGSLTIDGGSFETGRLVKDDGGVFNFLRGSYTQTGEDLRVGEGGIFGKSLDVSPGRTINVGSDSGPGRTLVIEPGADVTIRGAGPGGGVLTASSVQNDGNFVQEGGTFTARSGFINTGTAVFAGDHRWLGGVLNAQAGQVTLNSTMALPSPNPSLRPSIWINSGAHVSFGSTQRLRELQVAGTAAVQPGKSVVLHAERLILATDATLDLADADLILGASETTQNETLAAVVAAIRSSRNSDQGLWKGPGLTSSAAAAAADGLTTLAAVANPGLTHFGGQPVGPHDVLVKYTWNGDANVDGKVNADDYFRIDSGFLADLADPTFAQGDFNYDGTINADDYFLIDSAFLGQGAPLANPDALATPFAAMATAVPEPTTGLAMTAAAGIALSARRRRQRR